MSDTVYLDLDDFCWDNNSLDLLISLKSHIPQLKVTLFTIPGLCNPGFINIVRTIGLYGDDERWIDLVPHGFLHRTNYECLKWNYEECAKCLDWAMDVGITTRGFKAPGWQISDACYHCLKDKDYWVADQPYNDKRRLDGVRVYKLGPDSIHGHIGHMNGRNENELSLITDTIMESKSKQFGFVSEKVEVWKRKGVDGNA